MGYAAYLSYPGLEFLGGPNGDEIEEEKRRSAAIIAEIRQRTDDATAAAKQQRDETLGILSAQRAENEAVLRNSAALVAETEKQGQVVMNQIDEWLSYLK